MVGSISKLKTLVVLVILAVFFVCLNLTNLSSPIKNFFYSLSLPIERLLWQRGAAFSGFLEAVFQSDSLKRENAELGLQNRDLLSKLSALSELERENKVLREALNLGAEKGFDLLFSQVVLKDAGRDSLLIEGGEEDGVRSGMPVITGQKALLGRIGMVYENFSEVVLISSKESSFDAKILKEGAEKETYGVVKGEGGFGIVLDLVSKEERISSGDIVVSAALGGIFPKGLLVGKILKVNVSDLEPFQRAELVPAFDLDNLDKVFMISNFSSAPKQ